MTLMECAHCVFDLSGARIILYWIVHLLDYTMGESVQTELHMEQIDTCMCRCIDPHLKQEVLETCGEDGLASLSFGTGIE